MAIKITGQSVFMDFEHTAETDKAANKFIKGMLKINRDMTLRENPKPAQQKMPSRTWPGRSAYKIIRPTSWERDKWREANKQYRLSITIERV